MKQRLVVVDYGTGNAFSLRKALERSGAQVDHTSDPEIIRRSDKIVLPGIGHFGRTMSRLRTTGLSDVLSEEALIRGKPVLGVCLGMELYATRSEEGAADGLNWISGNVVRFEIADKHRYKVPHVGWNTAHETGHGRLLDGIEEGSEFYFLHSYHFVPVGETAIIATSRYEEPFVSVVEQGNVFGVQFHPEKSYDSGAKVLSNFLEI